LIIEGLGTSGQTLVADVIKNGISYMYSNFHNLANFRMMARRMVQEGALSESTVEGLFEDMKKFGADNLKDWKINSDDGGTEDESHE
jgi:hypothetical protein